MTDIETDGYEYGVGWKGEAESQRARAEVAEAKLREALKKLAEVSSPARPDFKKMLRDEIACQEGYAASTEPHAGLTTPREHRHTASVLRSMLLLIEFREGAVSSATPAQKDDSQ